MSLRSLQSGTVNVVGRLMQRLVLLSSAVGKIVIASLEVLYMCNCGLDTKEALVAGKSYTKFVCLRNLNTNYTPVLPRKGKKGATDF